MRVVLTGAPGSGKTTLIDALRDRGMQCVQEAAIDVIEALIDEMGLEEQANWRRYNMEAFQSRVLARQKELEQSVEIGKKCFFDRSAYDGISYLSLFNDGQFPANYLDDVREHSYDVVVFVSPLDALDLRAESGRNETEEEAQRLGDEFQAMYQREGFTIVHLPPAPIEQRVDMLIDVVNNHAQYSVYKKPAE